MKKATKYVGRKLGSNKLSLTTYRKYEESAHMLLLVNPISEPSLDISPIWIPVISEEIGKLQHRSVCFMKLLYFCNS
jgi:hypothetical protein